MQYKGETKLRALEEQYEIFKRKPLLHTNKIL